MANLKILYTNADQLSNKMDLLKLRIAADLPDVVCVNEVNPKNSRYEPFAAEYSLDQSNRFDSCPAQYSYIPNSLDSKIGRGQAVYFKSTMDAKRV